MQPQQQTPNTVQNNQLYPPNPYATPQLAPASMLPPTPNGLPANKPPVGLIVGLVVMTLLFIVSVVLALVFYMQASDYKNNSDQKSAFAVEQAKEQQKKELETVFAEKEKEPLVSYTSPADLGSVFITYPKTWSAYIDENASSGTPLNAYFHPNFVPTEKGSSENETNFALRAQVLQQSYKQVNDSFAQQIKKGEATATALTGLPGGTTGVRIDGKIDSKKTGSVIIIPVRDKVLKIWTEGDGYKNDFNNFVVKNLKFNP